MRRIEDLELAGKKLLMRVDFNVPFNDDGSISDDVRIKAALASIKYALDKGASVICCSHLGRPKGFDAKYSLSPVAKRLGELLGIKVELAKDVAGDDASAKAKALKSGEVLLLENLRYEAGETKNDADFAKRLASLANCYVNDAFGASHRAHASIDAVARLLPSAAGFLLQKEVDFAKKVLENPARPFVAVLGGSKVSGKLEAIKNLLPKVDKLIIAGGMAYTFFKTQGMEIGTSLCEDDLLDEAKAIMSEAKRLNKKLYLPVDTVIAPEFSANSISKIVPSAEIPAAWMGLDIGPASSLLFSEVLSDAKTIWWNGPVGVFEMDAFATGSLKLASAISSSHALSIAGGGDTAALLAKSGQNVDFLSTGGGASLELIEGKSLPGIVVLEGEQK